MGHDHDDPEDLKEILSVVSTEIPKLIEAITSAMYKPEHAQNMAKSVADFYKSMRDAGMDEKTASELTKEFMANFSLGSMISKAIQGSSRGGGDDDDLDEMIERKIKEKWKKKQGHDEEREEDG
jgi:hypothetical protein